MTLGDLLKINGKESQLINGAGISEALNGLGLVIMAFVIGKMTDNSGSFDGAQMLSGFFVVFSGALALLISPMSKKFKNL